MFTNALGKVTNCVCKQKDIFTQQLSVETIEIIVVGMQVNDNKNVLLPPLGTTCGSFLFLFIVFCVIVSIKIPFLVRYTVYVAKYRIL